ncbi:hypothetical protein E2C01_081883 [Portunus trituberculatus]|uniref:Uncharacterized protein n=1 Tax=Portunus trituberculatus TaxID=210409 RepID=A0A5B7J3H4_PORTR|nr:hypothetical protein [Portunus trituberculatus]
MVFHYMEKDMMKKIITSMMHPRLEYAAVNIRKLERIQKIAKKMVPELKDLTFKKRLKEMELPTL